MAITIQQQPTKFPLGYNDLVFVATSTNTAQPNMKYVFDLKDSAGNLVERIKSTPRPTGQGVFNAKGIVKSFLGFDINIEATTIDGFKLNSNSYYKFKVEFREEYDIAGVSTVSAVLATSGDKWAFNSIADFLDFNSYSSADYLLIAGGSSKKFLTNAPRSQDIFSAQNAWLYLMTDTASVVDKMQIKTYNSAGTLIDTHYVTNAYTTAGDTEKFQRFPCGTQNLNEIDPTKFTTGGQPVITASVASYKIRAWRGVDFFGAACSEEFTFTVQQNCSKYSNYRLHFLNKLGGFDSFNFTLLSRTAKDITRDKYKKQSSYLTGNSWGYTAKDRGDVAFNTKSKKKIRITSDYLSEDQSTWLGELVDSPEVYLELNPTTLVAVNIETNNYEDKKVVNDKLFNLELDISYSHDNYRQRY